MATGLQRRLSRRFDQEIRFFKGWMDGPRAVGAIAPTSAVTARRMASVVRPDAGLPVLELGPGTGVITKAILARGIRPADLVAVEYSADFYAHLVRDFPGVRFIHGDALDLDETLGELNTTRFDCVISAVPLLNFPMEDRVRLIEDLLGRIPVGRPVVQISYGPLPPVSARRGAFRVDHLEWIVRNIPPAQLWLYRRP